MTYNNALWFVVEKECRGTGKIEKFYCASKSKAQAAKRQIKNILGDDLENYKVEVRINREQRETI